MSKVLQKIQLAPGIFEIVVEAPRVARKAEAGQFVVVMADERGERIPLTIADFDRQKGTITLVLMVVGTSSTKLSRLPVGGAFYALIGPLGKASEIHLHEKGSGVVSPSEIQAEAKGSGNDSRPLLRPNTVVMVAGGVGTAPIYPIAREFHNLGCKVISIQGARTKELLFWTERLALVSDRHIITTDDGSAGRKGVVTDPLRELFEGESADAIGCVYAIGPAIMMKFCCQTTAPFQVKTIVSLNPVMVDGTGMCGGCRVDVGGQTRFTCADGPEFDGHLVDWDELLFRQKIYAEHEACSLDRYVKEYQQKHEPAAREI
jgi:ferredoxin--NADP+ reductase